MTTEKMEMRALIYHGIQDVRVETCPIPECGPDDVIVRTMRAAICGSDMTAYLHGGENMYILPGHEFGHEMVGYVWKKGAQVTGFVVVLAKRRQQAEQIVLEPIRHQPALRRSRLTLPRTGISPWRSSMSCCGA